MGKYTTEIRTICESTLGYSTGFGFNELNEKLPEVAPLIFNFDFPIFDEAYRIPLEVKILRHYFTREISEETLGLWKLRMQDRLCMIMPYYNKLYESELIEFNPLYDTDLTRTHNLENEADRTARDNETKAKTETDTQHKTNTDIVTREREDETTNTNTTQEYENAQDSGESNNLEWDLYSDTPQGGINGIQGDTVEDNYYLTNARKRTNNSDFEEEKTRQNTTTDNFNGDLTVNEEVVTDGVEHFTRNVGSNENNARNEISNVTTTEEYIEHVVGKNSGVTFSKMILEFRETLLNIDKMIIEELNDLFFGLW